MGGLWRGDWMGARLGESAEGKPTTILSDAMDFNDSDERHCGTRAD